MLVIRKLEAHYRAEKIRNRIRFCLQRLGVNFDSITHKNCVHQSPHK